LELKHNKVGAELPDNLLFKAVKNRLWVETLKKRDEK